MGELYAGAAIVDISPRQGIELAGYPHFHRENTGIHDPLYASCLYLDNGLVKLAVVAMDLCKYSKRYVRRVRQRAAEKTGIPAANILISCSHTHSGPLAAGRLDLEGIEKGVGPDAQYLDQLETKLVALIAEAGGNTFKASIGVAKGYCGKAQGVGGNRRNPDGPSDPEVWVLGVRDSQKRWRACMVNYTLHPSFIHGESTVVSADYPGYLRRYLAEAQPGIAVLFTQGASGDQSSRYFRSGQTFAEAERAGQAIGREAARALATMETASDVALFVKSIEEEVEVKRLPSREEAAAGVAAAQARLASLKAGGTAYVEIRNAEVALLGAENLLGHVRALESGRNLGVLEEELPVEVQVIGIGAARMVGIQGEWFVEYGLKIKADSPFDLTCVVTLANGALPGYVCTEEAYRTGGYEAGTSLMTAKSGTVLTDTALRLLKET